MTECRLWMLVVWRWICCEAEVFCLIVARSVLSASGVLEIGMLVNEVMLVGT